MDVALEYYFHSLIKINFDLDHRGNIQSLSSTLPADKPAPRSRAKATPLLEPDYVQYINKKLAQQAADNERKFKVQHKQLLELQQQNNTVLTASQNIILENKKLQEKMQQLLAENESVKKELTEARVLINKLQQAADQQQQQKYYPLMNIYNSLNS